jgi:hypothetical protein
MQIPAGLVHASSSNFRYSLNLSSEKFTERHRYLGLAVWFWYKSRRSASSCSPGRNALSFEVAVLVDHAQPKTGVKKAVQVFLGFRATGDRNLPPRAGDFSNGVISVVWRSSPLIELQMAKDLQRAKKLKPLNEFSTTRLRDTITAQSAPRAIRCRFYPGF